MKRREPEDLSTFGGRLTAAMQAVHITGLALSAATGVDAGYISKLRNGERQMPSATIVEHFAAALKVRGTWLALGTEPRAEVAEPSPRAPAPAEARRRAPADHRMPAAREAAPLPSGALLAPTGLSPNAAIAMDEFCWDGLLDLYDAVEAALVERYTRERRDRLPGWWSAEIRRLVAERRGVDVPVAPTASPPPEPSPVDEEVGARTNRLAGGRRRKTR